MRVWWTVLVIGGFIAAGCGVGSSGNGTTNETVTPVVVLPAPIEAAAVPPTTAFEAEFTIVDGYDPLLADAPGDTPDGTPPAFDLVSAHAVATSESLLLRVASSQPMSLESCTDVRLWVEQGEKLLTVEAKPDHPDRICELTPIGDAEGEELKGCLELGTTLDLRIPLDRLPSWLDTSEAYFVSGISTCCADEGREKPYDEIEGAQEVWVFEGEIPDVAPADVADDAVEPAIDAAAAAPAP